VTLGSDLLQRIVVLTGGSTPERTVALAGAAQVVAALRRVGFAVTVVDTVDGILDAASEAEKLCSVVGATPPSARELAELQRRENLAAVLDAPEIRGCDVLVPVLHGNQGEGGLVQRMLEERGICFAGSDAEGSERAMDKEGAKRLLREAGVATPRWAVWPASGGGVHPESLAALGAPVVVKPSRVGSTVGLTVVDDPRDRGALERAVATAREFDELVLVEEFLPGRELTVGILGDRALGVGEIRTPGRIFDFESKYTPGIASEIFPADLAEELRDEVQSMALAAHRLLGLRDFSRVDFRLDAAGRPSCLEVNTLPGMTATSLLPQSAACVGIGFEELCRRIVEMVSLRCVGQHASGGPG
jgi:D-alanine-D-alanine ligase